MNLTKSISTFVYVAILFCCKSPEPATLPPTINSFAPQSGNVGAQVTIRGYNFGKSPAAFINEIPVVVSAFSPGASSVEDQVTITVPLAASTGKIKVANGNLTGLSTVDFTVTIDPPLIQSFSPTSGNFGTTVTITGLNFLPNSIVKFNGVAATVNQNTTTLITAVVPQSASTGKITIEASNSVAVSLSDFFANYNGTWKYVSNFNGLLEVYSYETFVINDQFYLYVAYGSANSTGQFWKFDVTSGSWIRVADFPGGIRGNAFGFSIGTKGYVGGGGFNSISLTDFWEYDVSANAWTRKSDTPSFSSPTLWSIGFSVGSKGYTTLGDPVQLWSYDPVLNQWTRKSDFPSLKTKQKSGFVINGKFYVGTTNSREFWEYDPAIDNWVRMTDFPGSQRNDATTFSLNGNGYMGAGFGGSTTYQFDVWKFDPTLNQWFLNAPFPGTTSSNVAFVIGNKGYAGSVPLLNIPTYLYEFTP